MCVDKRAAEDGVGVVPDSGPDFIFCAPAMKAFRFELDELRIWRSEDADHLREMLGSVVCSVCTVQCAEEITTAAESPYLRFESVGTSSPSVSP